MEKSVEEEKKRSETYLEQYKYLKADFENYKKISEKDIIRTVKNANENLIKDLLPVMDDIENAIEKSKIKEEKIGMKMIHHNLMKVLERNGLKEIEAKGKKFDTYYHEVLMKEKSDKEEGIILEEIQKGYMFNDKVIRHSKVKISS